VGWLSRHGFSSSSSLALFSSILSSPIGIDFILLCDSFGEERSGLSFSWSEQKKVWNWHPFLMTLGLVFFSPLGTSFSHSPSSSPSPRMLEC